MCVDAKRVAKFLNTVKKEYPEVGENVHDTLLGFYSRAIAWADGVLERGEELTFPRILSLFAGAGYASDEASKIVEEVLAGWPEVSGNEAVREVVVGYFGESRIDMTDLTRAWNLYEIATGGNLTGMYAAA